jgi:hypothetical protein
MEISVEFIDGKVKMYSKVTNQAAGEIFFSIIYDRDVTEYQGGKEVRITKKCRSLLRLSEIRDIYIEGLE